VLKILVVYIPSICNSRIIFKRSQNLLVNPWKIGKILYLMMLIS